MLHHLSGDLNLSDTSGMKGVLRAAEASWLLEIFSANVTATAAIVELDVCKQMSDFNIANLQNCELKYTIYLKSMKPKIYK